MIGEKDVFPVLHVGFQRELAVHAGKWDAGLGEPLASRDFLVDAVVGSFNMVSVAF